MSPSAVSLIPDRAAAQRRTLAVLRLAVVPGQAAVAGTVAVVSLLAKDMLGSDRLAGLGSASFTLGSAMAAIPLAAFMRRRGRRPGLALAFSIGAVGALVAAAGGQARWFWLFVIGMVLFGSGQSATLQTRYAAADLATPDERATAIGAIVWIGTLGAVFYLTLLRPDPLVLAGGVDPSAARVRPIQQARRSFGVIRSSRGAMLGLVAMAGSQAAMVGVMTMTPSHMDDHGHADLSSMVIAMHIVGMFGIAPLVGRFVDRVGPIRAMQIGAVTLGISTVVVQIAGYVPLLVFVGLFLLGLGWNLGLIAGTTLLTASVPEGSRVEAQGTGDLTLSLCGAVAAFGSGFVKQAFEFHILADLATVLAGGMLVYGWYTGARFSAAVSRAR